MNVVILEKTALYLDNIQSVVFVIATEQQVNRVRILSPHKTTWLWRPHVSFQSGKELRVTIPLFKHKLELGYKNMCISQRDNKWS